MDQTDIGRRHALGLLAALAAVMALTPDTDQFSQFLRLAFFRSPNYQAGVSGWTINQDGSVEFNNGTFRGFIVGGRLFLYSGTPGAGNPPVAYAAPPGVTTDPFGNVLPVTTGGFVASSSSNGQFGVLQNAALLLGSVNVSTRIIADGTLALLDALADNVAPGIAITGPSTPTGGGAQVNVLGESKDASKPAQIVMGAPIAAPSTTALLEVQGSEALKGIATPASPPAGNALLFADTSGFLRMLAGLAGDTTVYETAHLMTSATATPQTISSTSATTITGCTAPVGIRRYAFRARVAFHGASASGTANFSVTGPAVTSQWITAAFTGTGAVGVGFQNAALGPVNSFTQTTTEMMADIEGEGTFTAAGTIALACAMSSGGANVIIDRAHFWLYPV